ncbi:MAG: DNA-binding protein [Bacteroidales bacterium]
MEVITFNELRKIKHTLPDGSMQKIANLLGISPDSVRNYFGGDHPNTPTVGIHYEQGPDGGIVTFDDPKILHIAKEILVENKLHY